MKYFETIYFIVDSETQASLYNPWKSSFERRGYIVEIINTENLAYRILQSMRIERLLQLYRWSRRDVLNSKIQSLLVKCFRPVRSIILRRINFMINVGVSDKNSLAFVFKGLDVKPSTLKTLKNQGVQLVTLNGDSYFNMQSSNQFIIDGAKFYDLVITWSDALDNELKSKLGLSNTKLLPFSCEEILDPVKPSWLNLDLSRSLVFVGVWDKEREKSIRNIRYKNIVVFGPYWERRGVSFPPNIKVFALRVTPSDMAYIYEHSAACLNLMRPQNEGSHNMKTFEIPAAKGVVILPCTEYHIKTFKKSESVYYYDQITDIEQIMSQILTIDPDRRRKSAESTSGWVLREHSYDARLENLLQYLKEC